LSSADWSTFNSKQGTITLTTTGTSGAATFSSNTLNIPNYGSALSGYLPLTGGTLTGALSGTSATFSSNFYVSGGTNTNVGNGIHAYYESSYAQIQLNGATGSLIDFSTSGTDSLGRIIYTNATNQFEFKTNGASVLTLASTGAATFSSSVTATSFNGTTNNIFSVSGTEGMRLTSTGLGIGTTSPLVSLQVRDSGNTYSAHFSGNNQVNGIGIGTISTNVAAIQGYTRTFSATNDIVMQPDGGNLGLGVTPSAWGSNYKAIQGGNGSNGVGGSFAFFNNLANGVILYSNAYNDNTNDIYTFTAPAAKYVLENNVYKWFQAPQGNTGNAITFTQAMTLDASGRLGIGTTSPSYKLDVNGSFNLGTNAYINYTASYPYTITIANTAGVGDIVLNAGAGSSGYESKINLQGGTSGYLQFSAASSERMRITSGGNVGIGTTSPAYKLDVNGGIYGKGLTADSDGGVGSALYAYNQVLSGSSTAALIQLTTSWNTTGNADAIVLDVTNTASGASSRLLDLKVNGSSIFKVQRNGRINASSLPTSSVGLSAGDIWNDGGTLKIV
jgi:hypothetical protein